MKIKVGQTPNSIVPEGWLEVPETIKNSKLRLLLSVVLGLVLMKLLDFIEPDFVTYGKIYLLIILIPVHEFLHIACFKRPNNSNLNIDLKRILVFVTTEEIFHRRRLLISLVMPFIILTLIPLIITLTIWENSFMNYIILYNMLASGGDIISTLTLIRAKGTYFKIVNNRLYTRNLILSK